MMIRKYVLGWADNKVCDQKQVPTLLLFLTPILILAVLEVNTVHNSLLFDIHCTCIVSSTNEFQISPNSCIYHRVAKSRVSL